MPVESMTPRERWQAVLDRKTPDRVPMDYWSTPEADEKLVEHLGVDTIDEALERLHVDKPCQVGPRYVGPALAPDTDVFGCRHQTVEFGRQ